ncbi:hypothetical protein [Kaarinaea lacus]
MQPAHHGSVISRRRFLSYLTVPAVMSFTTSGGVFATPKGFQSNLGGHLGFVDREGLGPRVDAPVVQNYFVPLHEEQSITAQVYEPEEIAVIKSVLKSEFESEGYEWNDAYEIKFSYQHYGVPDDSEHGAHLLQYCERVHEFLYSRLSGLFDVDMRWQMLPSDHYEDPEQGQGFQGNVGRYTYYLLRAYVDDAGLDDLPSLINSQSLERAIHYIVGGEFSLPKKASLYIIPGQTSLVAPFSELLHLTFHAPSQNYAIELGKTLPEQQAHQYAVDAGETINEATAILLAKEYISKYGASERITTIDAMANNLNGRFNQLHGAINFIKRNGVQKSLDIYLENPGRFMQQIARA